MFALKSAITLRWGALVSVCGCASKVDSLSESVQRESARQTKVAQSNYYIIMIIITIYCHHNFWPQLFNERITLSSGVSCSLIVGLFTTLEVIALTISKPTTIMTFRIRVELTVLCVM